MRQDFVPEPVARPTPAPREHVPLDQLTLADVAAIVQKVVETRRDQARIAAAKFSSSI